MRISFIVIFLLFKGNFIHAQQYEWAIKLMPTGLHHNFYSSAGVLFDNKQNAVVTSFTSGEIIKMGGARIAYKDSFIGKIDRKGNYVWGVHITGSSNNGFIENLCLIGNRIAFTITVQDTFPVYIGSFKMPKNKPNDGYVALIILDENGTVQSCRKLTYPPERMVYDGEGHFYTCGGYIDTAKFSSTVQLVSPTSDYPDHYTWVACLDTMGTYLWAKSYGRSGEFDQYPQIAVSRGTLYMSIISYTRGNWRPGPRICMYKFDKFGNAIDSAIYSGRSTSMTLSCDSVGNVFMSSILQKAPMDIGGLTVPSLSNGASCLAIYDSNLKAKWFELYGGNVNAYVFLSCLYSNTINKVFQAGSCGEAVFKLDTFTLKNNSYKPSKLKSVDFMTEHKLINGNINNVYELETYNLSTYMKNLVQDSCLNFYVYGTIDGNYSDTGYIKLGRYTLLYDRGLIGDFLFKYNPHKLKFYVHNHCTYDSLFADADPMYDSLVWTFQDSSKTYGKSIAHNFTKKEKYPVWLEGYSKKGCQQIILDTVFHKLVSPIANFRVSSTKGCQWVSLQFNDSSKTDTLNIKKESWKWSFGDGIMDSVKNPKHIYKSNGVFTVGLTYSNGFCSNTDTIPQKIIIVPAPKPGFVASPNEGCSPLKVKLNYMPDSNTVKVKYSTSDSQTSLMQEPVFYFKIPGHFSIHQEVTGKTGCVTTDSQQVTVFRSFTQSDTVHIDNVTVSDDNSKIKVSWDSIPGIKGYFLKKTSMQNFSFMPLTLPFNQYSYIDSAVSPNNESYSYTIQGLDSCGNLSALSRKVSSILLKGKNADNNDEAELSWNVYKAWRKDISYTVERKNNAGVFNPMQFTAIQDTFFMDATFAQTDKYEKCYRIEANGLDSKKEHSQSNYVCIAYKPIIKIPDIFSPNGDGLNDELNVYTFAIRSFDLFVYNRWGQRIYTGSANSKRWAGENASVGVYFYTLNAVGYNNEDFYIKGTITLIR